MAGNFIALCNENEEAPLVVIAGRETFVISLLTRIGYGGQFCCDAHRGALNVLSMTARHPVSCPSMCFAQGSKPECPPERSHVSFRRCGHGPRKRDPLVKL